MKKFFFSMAIFSAVNSFAQKNKGIILSKGQKITVVTTSTADMDMGFGASAKSNSESTNELNVIDANDKNYSISNKTTKLKLSTPDATGQQVTLDSEKQEDLNSDAGKEFFGKLNVADTLLVDKISGIVGDNKNNSPERPAKDDKDENALTSMMEGMGAVGSKVILDGAFFIIPKEKKVGDSWADSAVEKTMTTKKTYTIKSIDKNVATITITGAVTGNGETEINGQTVSFSINAKNNGETIADTKTGLVSKITNDADVTMTIELMGQSMPLTSKVNSTTTYQY